MLTLTTNEVTSWVGGVIWPFIRIGSMFVAAPIFGAGSVPVRVRLALALVLAWALQPYLPSVPPIDPVSLEGLLVSASQVLIGIVMGFILQMVFSAMVLAGQAIALSMGLGFAVFVDPQSGAQVPTVSQIYVILATLLFLSMNGQLMLIDMLVRSFRLMPVGPLMLSNNALWEIVTWGGTMYAAAMLVALPAVAALMLVNLAFGVITRAAPQLNIFAVGFPLTLMLGLVLIMFSLPTVLPRFTALFTQSFTLMFSVLGGH
ncbi:flagellar biosynthetic protein FliR [Acidihalobacter ferrooxydans]|uniref:Flagellar biosynthetic protein FliR n=1 Tax=Acidihalobacter ferrooxydans TaxID=1765967 RepID=A0A1P8UGW9_9GAMM|nr:flagellar biosynthetic protein FliR [Acidihalobacter ferrooxydans]APZ43021.1 flagellar biosynthetic protein FliR [Acidihalobacter ferrooxydans]